MNGARLWRNGDFVKLWTGQAISTFGTRLDALGYTAILVLAASPVQLGVLTALEAAPVLFIGLFAGVWVDRVRRRPLLIGADAGRALLLLTVPLAAALGVLSLLQLIIVAVLTGVLTVFFDVAHQSYVPVVVSREALVEANSRLGMSGSLAEVLGPGLAGVLVQLLSATTAVLLDALTFIASAISLGAIRHREPRVRRSAAHTPVRGEIAQGMRAVLWQPTLRALAFKAGTDTFFGGFFGTLYTLYLLRVLGIGPAGVGLTIAFGGAGDLIGAYFAPNLARRFGQGHTLIGAALLSNITAFLYPLAGGPVLMATVLVCAAQFLGDMGHAVYGVHETSVRQTITPQELLGRVNATSRVIGSGPYPIGLLVAGFLAESIGIRGTIWLAVIGFLLSTGWLLISPLTERRDPVGS